MPAGLDAWVSHLLLTRTAETGASCVVLIGWSKAYLYPLSRLVERGLRVLVVEPESRTSAAECRGYMTHRLQVREDGRLQDWVEEVRPFGPYPSVMA